MYMVKYSSIGNKKNKSAQYWTTINPELVDELYQRIMQKFIVEKKYRDPNYTARSLARELGTNMRYISAVVNLRFQDNYSQLVNDFRIKEAMYKLKDAPDGRLKVEDVAREVGFANRQTFYAAFYKRTGMSPKEFYRKSIEEKSE